MMKLIAAVVVFIFILFTCGESAPPKPVVPPQPNAAPVVAEQSKAPPVTAKQPKATQEVAIPAEPAPAVVKKPEITEPATPTKERNFMSKFFVVISHMITVAGIFALVYGIYRAIVETTVIQERIVRGLALVTGSFAYIAARALGVSIPALMVEAVAQGQILGVVFLGLIIPSLAGFFMARYVIWCMKNDDVIAMRVMFLISSLVLIMFADVYSFAAAESNKLESLKPLLPNVTFLLTIMLYIVLVYRPVQRVGFGASSPSPSSPGAEPEHEQREQGKEPFWNWTRNKPKN